MDAIPRTILLPNEHTGKIREHRHTAYPVLIFMLVVMTLVLAAFGTVARAANLPVKTAVSYGVTGTVPGKPPVVAGFISDPAAGKHFSGVTATVAGSCPAATLVKVFRNNIFGGAIFCDKNGNFSLPVSLFYGRNDLEVEVYNSVNAEGPESDVVTVYCDATAAAGSIPGSAQLVINSANSYKGVYVGDTVSWPLEILGGTPPYAVAVDWGDAATDLVSKTEPGTLTLDHVYDKGGIDFRSSYGITGRVSDAAGNQTSIRLTTIVAGADVQTSPVAFGDTSGLTMAWPLLDSAILAVICFMLGERYELLKLRRHPETLKA
jgi:hypothetical protein